MGFVRAHHFLDAYYLTMGCKDCGSFDLVVLESDHVYGRKTAIISNLAKKGDLRALVDELTKCETRCHRCHKLRHHPHLEKPETRYKRKKELPEDWSRWFNSEPDSAAPARRLAAADAYRNKPENKAKAQAAAKERYRTKHPPGQPRKPYPKKRLACFTRPRTRHIKPYKLPEPTMGPYRGLRARRSKFITFREWETR